MGGLSWNLSFVIQTLGKTPMQLKRTNQRSHFTSQRCLKFLEKGNRQPIRQENQKRLTPAVSENFKYLWLVVRLRVRTGEEPYHATIFPTTSLHEPGDQRLLMSSPTGSSLRAVRPAG